MTFLYRYIDKSDDVTKYIGIVYGNNRSLYQRINEHKKDNWFKTSVWIIKYIELGTRSEAEAFESHFIAKYETFKYFNKAKSNWGINRYLLEDVTWITFGNQEKSVAVSKKCDNSLRSELELDILCQTAIIKHALLL